MATFAAHTRNESIMPIFPEAVLQQLSAAALRPIGWTLNATARLSQPLAGEWALRIFSRPRARISTLHDPQIFQDSEQIRYQLDRYGLDINLFYWQGNGPTVLLAHGWESNSSRWLPLIQALRALDFQIISVDAPAHGLSGGKQFNVVMYTEVLKELFQNYRPQVFIGHSAGGMAGVYHLHQKNLPTLQHLILLAVPNELEDLMDIFRQIVGMNDLVFSGLKQSFTDHFGFPMSSFSMHKFVKDIQIPGLIIQDRTDSFAPYSGGMAIHQNWSGSKLVTTDGLGHSLPGEEVVAAVVHYLQNSGI